MKPFHPTTRTFRAVGQAHPFDQKRRLCWALISHRFFLGFPATESEGADEASAAEEENDEEEEEEDVRSGRPPI